MILSLLWLSSICTFVSTVKESLKSSYIWQSYDRNEKGAVFLTHSVCVACGLFMYICFLLIKCLVVMSQGYRMRLRRRNVGVTALTTFWHANTEMWRKADHILLWSVQRKPRFRRKFDHVYINVCCLHHSLRIRILCFFSKFQKKRFLRFFKWHVKKHRKHYQVCQISRTLAYTVHSETNTYTYNSI